MMLELTQPIVSVSMECVDGEMQPKFFSTRAQGTCTDSGLMRAADIVSKTLFTAMDGHGIAEDSEWIFCTKSDSLISSKS
jgi:hypothetical protein